MSSFENPFVPPDDISQIIRDRFKRGISARETFVTRVAEDIAAIANNRIEYPCDETREAHPLVQVSNLSFNYKSTKWTLPWTKPPFSPLALSDVSMTFCGPGVTMLAGRSGCGKSTLLRLLGGIQPYDKSQVSGSLTFPVLSARDDTYASPTVDALTAPRRLQRHLRDAASVMLIESHEWPEDEDSRKDMLDHVLFHTFNRIVFLDEPLRLLDPRDAQVYEDKMRRMADHGERTFVVVTHDWRFIRVADHIFLMEGGRVIIDDSALGVLKRGDLPNYLQRTLDNPSPR